MNRLAAETSPYLRQHAANPVDWYPWGPEAFAAARARDVPLFVSVGYSACHWCHVMAHESFEDPAVGALLDDRFVSVKVDREERPDVDAIYMAATQATTGRGGWPMSVWLTPDGRPFHCGTYFPPDDRQGMPSFRRVCEAVSDAWRDRRSEVLAASERLTSVIGTGLPTGGADLDPATGGAPTLDAARDLLLGDADPRWGGFGRAPKFPQPAALSFLCRAAAVDLDRTGERHARTVEVVTVTLDAMAAGGIYDQLGGGFARYSVDDHWLVPHFEKMLYDNAQLVRAYTHGWLLTGAPRYRRVVAETIAFVERELRLPAGGCASALDADSEGVEGKFYVWSAEEVREVCGSDADAAIRFYGITEHGNFFDPHTGFRGNVLRVVERDAEPDGAVERARAALRARRSARVRPACDDKVLLAWNALLARALAEAGWAFDQPAWLDAARATARFCLSHVRRADGRLLRSWHRAADPTPGLGADGRARHLAYGDDHGALLEALVTLAEVDDLAWLEPAVELAGALVALFAAGDGGFFATGADAEALVVRPRDEMDGATPSATSLAANGLIRLGALTGDARWTAAGEAALRRVAPFLARHPLAFAYALEAAERAAGPSREIAIVGPRGDSRTRALQRVVAGRLLRATVVATAEAGASPLLAGRSTVGGAPAAYVCEHYTCAAPVTEPAALAALLDAAPPSRSSGSGAVAPAAGQAGIE